ncbi:hypothetical protein A3A39_02235 [Candidatus Kaiserbacteria bacterium RIFCSPLOWO2_01_FULL_54_13]|uniref:Tripartite tricarboxylate transporter substrate binding protein n=1 Tax=Candidatus Kaiserbacteria bacterium RIFCSPLOWO2_01_FULL_54_13 TaxID=1798512 RepID=A0A1F6F182_9BACT|nr:MAG: hypothetical protein A3A39_02235 [Candidatus Kaiserbacteria bacterium RIFCSPLOWO2_01_FULL_54_13]
MIRGITTALAILLMAASTQADDYPSRPISIIVPSEAGGTHAFVHVIKDALSEKLGVPVVPESRPAGAGSAGGVALKNAVPDGYTYGFFPSGVLVGIPPQRKHPPYDPEDDFEPISLFTNFCYVFITHAGIPALSVNEFMTWGRSIEIFFAYRGETGRVAATLLKKHGVRIVDVVAYRGERQAVTEIQTGRQAGAFVTLASALSGMQSGQVRLLAVINGERCGALPEVPTMGEVGMPEFAAIAPWGGVFAPKNTPP